MNHDSGIPNDEVWSVQMAAPPFGMVSESEQAPNLNVTMARAPEIPASPKTSPAVSELSADGEAVCERKCSACETVIHARLAHVNSDHFCNKCERPPENRSRTEIDYLEDSDFTEPIYPEDGPKPYVSSPGSLRSSSEEDDLTDTDSDCSSNSGSRSASETYLTDFGGEVYRDDGDWHILRVPRKEILRTYESESASSDSDSSQAQTCEEIEERQSINSWGVDADKSLDADVSDNEFETPTVVHTVKRTAVVSPTAQEPTIEELMHDAERVQAEISRGERVEENSGDPHASKYAVLEALPLQEHLSEPEVLRRELTPPAIVHSYQPRSETFESPVHGQFNDSNKISEDASGCYQSKAKTNQSIRERYEEKRGKRGTVGNSRIRILEDDGQASRVRAMNAGREDSRKRTKQLCERLDAVAAELAMLQVITASNAAEAEMNVPPRSRNSPEGQLRAEVAKLRTTVDLLARLCLEKAILTGTIVEKIR